MPRPVKIYQKNRYGPYKPKGFEDHLTRGELASRVGKDRKRLTQLEREGKIPAPIRVGHGTHKVRLYSPEDVRLVEAYFEGRGRTRR
jgi:hypothetical protein